MVSHRYITRADKVTTMSWYAQLFYMFFNDLLIVLSCIVYGFRMTMEKTFNSYRLWICWDLVCGMFGITTHTCKFLL